MVEYHPTSAEDLSRPTSTSAPKVLPGIFLGYVLYTREESGKETLWSQTWKNWRRWTHQNSTPEGSMLKEVSTPMKNEKFVMFPVADGTVKTPGGDQDLRTSTLIRDNPDGTRRRTR